MTDDTSKTATAKPLSIKEEIAAALKEFLPVVVDAAKAAVAVDAAIRNPPPAPRVYDHVDALVAPVPADALRVEDDHGARIAALESHVAALTVATGHDTSARMLAVKEAVRASASAH